MHVQVWRPVPVVRWPADLGKDRPSVQAEPRRDRDSLQVREDKHRIVRRAADQLQKNAQAPTAVAIVVIVDEKYRCVARGSYFGSLRHMEIDAEMHEVAVPSR